MEINMFEKVEEKQLKCCSTKQLMETYVLCKTTAAFCALSMVCAPILFELGFSMGVVGFIIALAFLAPGYRCFLNSKEIGEELRENRAKSDCNVLTTIKEERKKLITKTSIFVVAVVIFLDSFLR